MLKRALLDKFFSNLLVAVQIWYQKTFKIGKGKFFRNREEALVKIWLFLTTDVVTKDIKTNKNFADSDGQNILRLFDISRNFPFTASETKHDY